MKKQESKNKEIIKHDSRYIFFIQISFTLFESKLILEVKVVKN